jgi:hypothetical protein
LSTARPHRRDAAICTALTQSALPELARGVDRGLCHRPPRVSRVAPTRFSYPPNPPLYLESRSRVKCRRRHRSPNTPPELPPQCPCLLRQSSCRCHWSCEWRQWRHRRGQTGRRLFSRSCARFSPRAQMRARHASDADEPSSSTAQWACPAPDDGAAVTCEACSALVTTIARRSDTTSPSGGREGRGCRARILLNNPLSAGRLSGDTTARDAVPARNACSAGHDGGSTRERHHGLDGVRGAHRRGHRCGGGGLGLVPRDGHAVGGGAGERAAVRASEGTRWRVAHTSWGGTWTR